MPDLMTLQAANINGGSDYTFSHNPRDAKRIHKPKSASAVPTYGSSAVIDWEFLGTGEANGLKGTRWSLRWPYMTEADLTSLQDYFFADVGEVIVWNPKDLFTGSDKYEVIPIQLRDEPILSVDGYSRNVDFILEIRETAPP